jgi:hypothetical protein
MRGSITHDLMRDVFYPLIFDTKHNKDYSNIINPITEYNMCYTPGPMSNRIEEYSH